MRGVVTRRSGVVTRRCHRVRAPGCLDRSSGVNETPAGGSGMTSEPPGSSLAARIVVISVGRLFSSGRVARNVGVVANCQVSRVIQVLACGLAVR
jgi:hypothetical protein